MEENKNIPTTEGEAIAPEAPVTDIPGTDAPSPDLTAGVPQQEQAGATMTEPGDVVVSFDKIEELMAERRAAARDTVEKAEPAAPEVDAPAVEPVDPIPDAKAAEKATEEKPQEEVAAEQKKSRRGRPPKAEKAEQDGKPVYGTRHFSAPAYLQYELTRFKLDFVERREKIRALGICPDFTDAQTRAWYDANPDLFTRYAGDSFPYEEVKQIIEKRMREEVYDSLVQDLLRESADRQ